MRQWFIRAARARRQPTRHGAGVRLERQRGAVRDTRGRTSEGGGIQGSIRRVRERPVHERRPRGRSPSTIDAARIEPRARCGVDGVRAQRGAARGRHGVVSASVRRRAETRRRGVLPRLRIVRLAHASLPAESARRRADVRQTGRDPRAVLHAGRGPRDVQRRGSRRGGGGGGR